MKWSYKTVHFELKKEGLLGGSFLDETELEERLNDYGRSGWELISVIEVQNGVIAFFKQPIEIEGLKFAESAAGSDFSEPPEENDSQDFEPVDDVLPPVEDQTLPVYQEDLQSDLPDDIQNEEMDGYEDDDRETDEDLVPEPEPADEQESGKASAINTIGAIRIE